MKKKTTKKLSKKRLNDLWSTTSDCYSEACKEIGFNNFDLRDWYADDLITEEELALKAEQLDELYRKKICNLPSDVIEDVILANTKGLQRRAQKTIDNLISELLERQLKDEEG